MWTQNQSRCIFNYVLFLKLTVQATTRHGAARKKKDVGYNFTSKYNLFHILTLE